MAASSYPSWVHVGSVIESGTSRYTISQVLEPSNIIVLRSHVDNSEARYPADVILRNYRPLEGLKEWMRVGVRVKRRGSEDLATIVGVQGTNIIVRDFDPVLRDQLSSDATMFAAAEFDQLYVAVEADLPRWMAPGSRVVNRDQTYEVRDIDRAARAFTAVLISEPTRVVRFNLHNFEQHWKPFSTLNDTGEPPRRALAPAVIPVSTIPTAPNWLKPGSLLRPFDRNKRRSFWVMSIHPDRGMCRIQRVASFSPLQMEPEWEELAYEVAEKNWEPLNADGSPLSEKKCPHCGTWGGRDEEAETRSPYEVRIYHCLEGHRWSFIHGGSDDGKAAPPTRFERELDL